MKQKKIVTYRFECSVCGLHTFTDNFNLAIYHGDGKCDKDKFLDFLKAERKKLKYAEA